MEGREANNFKERKERAIKIVDELAAEGRGYSNASSVLRMAANELAERRSDEIIKRRGDTTL